MRGKKSISADGQKFKIISGVNQKRRDKKEPKINGKKCLYYKKEKNNNKSFKFSKEQQQKF
jgi:hypothetical protein